MHNLESASSGHFHLSNHHRDVSVLTPNSALLGFFPAFQDVYSQEVHLSTNEQGAIAAIHLLDGLPDYWVGERDQAGRIIALKEGIIAGFVRAGRFYTRADIARMPCDA